MAFDGYNCKSGRGFAAIVNFQRYSSAATSVINRYCEKEYSQLRELLPHFGFNVGYAKIDPTVDEVNKLLQEWASHNFEEYDHFLLIISAHGDEDGVFTTTRDSENSDSCAIPSKYVKINYEMFEQSIQSNRTLSGKPKWLVFACCHGLNADQGVMQMLSFLSTDSIEYKAVVLPTHADTLITHASVKGYCAFRTVEGTVLLQKLLERLNVHKVTQAALPSSRISLMQLCCELNASVADYLSNCLSSDLDKRKQMCEHINRLRADYYLTFVETPVEQIPYDYQCMKRETLSVKELSGLVGNLGLTASQKQDFQLRLSKLGIDIAIS